MGGNNLLDEIRERLRRIIRRNRRNYVSPRFDTSDVVQESMLQLLGDGDSNDDDIAEISNGLLGTVAQGHLAKQLRFHNAAKRSVEREDPASVGPQSYFVGTDPCDASMRAELTEKAINALAELDELHRKVVTLRFFEDATLDQIAERLEINVYTVRSKLAEALQHLNQKLDS